MGCGVIGAAKKVASNLSTITDFSEKLQNGLKLTYRAEYTDNDGKKVTVQQQPPNSVYLNDTGPCIVHGRRDLRVRQLQRHDDLHQVAR